MLKLKSFKKVVLGIVMLLLVNLTFSQDNKPPLSPLDSAKGILKSGATIKIIYSSPSVRDRKIWGELVPYHKVWRAGANNATQIEFDKDVKIDGNLLKAGKYSIYMIPEEESWSIIFSSQTGQSGMNHDGTSTLDFEKIVLRGLGSTKKSKSFNERLIYSINEKGIVLSWEKLDITLLMK